MPSSLGPAEILVILVVALIVLGPAKLPQAGRQVGKALSEIRRWTTEVKSEVTSAFDAESAAQTRPQEAAPSYTDYYPEIGSAPQAAAPPSQPAPTVDLSKPARDPAPAEAAAPSAESEAPVDDRP